MINYTTLTQEEFQHHCTALYAEQDRRAKLDSIPHDIQKLAQDFEDLGGNREDLVTKVNEPIVTAAPEAIEPVPEQPTEPVIGA